MSWVRQIGHWQPLSNIKTRTQSNLRPKDTLSVHTSLRTLKQLPFSRHLGSLGGIIPNIASAQKDSRTEEVHSVGRERDHTAVEPVCREATSVCQIEMYMSAVDLPK